MSKIRGFLEIRRAKDDYRPVAERVKDFKEFVLPTPDKVLDDQSARCMDCGVPFCHDGCPLGNLIPDFNEFVNQGRWDEAFEALYATNNFPEFTGRVCPAPCEASCVLNLQNEPVTIKAIERTIADRGGAGGQLTPRPSQVRTANRVAVIGSGPAGLAAAQQLARKGHNVTVFERDDRIGGLLRYGIPDFKMEKHFIDARVAQMQSEGVVFQLNADVGGAIDPVELHRAHDALVLCGGAMQPRELDVPGRELAGVHLAMDFLTQQNRRVAGESIPDDHAIIAKGKRVIVLGGGDTGSDCIGTAHRQGATHITSLELMPKPPAVRAPTNPWPAWPLILRTSSSHEEGGDRDFGVMTKRLVGDAQGRVRALEAVRVQLQGGAFREVEGSAFEIPCELVLLAMGFTGPVKKGLIATLGVDLDARGNVAARNGHTSVPGVFAAGDMARGASLVVWAIAEGRRVADAVDAWLVSRAVSAREAGAS